MNERFRSGPLTLAGHLAGATTGPLRPAVVLVHGYPSGPSGTAGALSAMPELADRLADDMGWVAFAPALRGMPGSEGDFSLDGWLSDIVAAIAHLRSVTRVSGVWLVGFGSGGALAICAGAADHSIMGVAALATPADFDDWATNPKRLIEHAREVGVIKSRNFPTSNDRFVRDLRRIKAVSCAPSVAPRPMLLVHGNDDLIVPSLDARIIADAHRSAEMRFIEGAGHRLRHDPRAMAVLLGWLDRHRHLASPRASEAES